MTELPKNIPLKVGTIMYVPTKRYHMILIFEDGEQFVSTESFATEREAEEAVKQWAEEQGGSYEWVH